MLKPPRFFVLPGGASHGPTILGGLLAALALYTPAGFAGASIGAVIAAAFALGIDREKIEAFCVKWFQSNRLVGGKPVIRPHPRMLFVRGGGMHDWSYVRKALQELFANARMRDVKYDLCIVVGDSYLGKPIYVTNRSHPDALIWQVLAGSTAIWPISDGQEAPSLSRGNRLYIDGGWGDNVPARAFEDRQHPSIIFYLSRPDVDKDGEADPVRREGFMGMLEAALEISLYAEPTLSRSDAVTVPIVPSGSGFDFSLSPRTIRDRILNGHRQARAILEPL